MESTGICALDMIDIFMGTAETMKRREHVIGDHDDPAEHEPSSTAETIAGRSHDLEGLSE